MRMKTILHPLEYHSSLYRPENIKRRSTESKYNSLLQCFIASDNLLSSYTLDLNSKSSWAYYKSQETSSIIRKSRGERSMKSLPHCSSKNDYSLNIK